MKFKIHKLSIIHWIFYIKFLLRLEHWHTSLDRYFCIFICSFFFLSNNKIAKDNHKNITAILSTSYQRLTIRYQKSFYYWSCLHKAGITRFFFNLFIFDFSNIIDRFRMQTPLKCRCHCCWCCCNISCIERITEYKIE